LFAPETISLASALACAADFCKAGGKSRLIVDSRLSEPELLETGFPADAR
jgi:hypothetical protein